MNDSSTYEKNNQRLKTIQGELYDLKNDIGEYNDVSQEYPQIVANLTKMMEMIQATANSMAKENTNCSNNITHPINPIVGPVWFPWC